MGGAHPHRWKRRCRQLCVCVCVCVWAQCRQYNIRQNTHNRATTTTTTTTTTMHRLEHKGGAEQVDHRHHHHQDLQSTVVHPSLLLLLLGQGFLGCFRGVRHSVVPLATVGCSHYSIAPQVATGFGVHPPRKEKVGERCSGAGRQQVVAQLRKRATTTLPRHGVREWGGRGDTHTHTHTHTSGWLTGTRQRDTAQQQTPAHRQRGTHTLSLPQGCLSPAQPLLLLRGGIRMCENWTHTPCVSADTTLTPCVRVDTTLTPCVSVTVCGHDAF